MLNQQFQSLRYTLLALPRPQALPPPQPSHMGSDSRAAPGGGLLWDSPPAFISASYSPHCWQRYNEVRRDAKEEGGRNAKGSGRDENIE